MVKTASSGQKLTKAKKNMKTQKGNTQTKDGGVSAPANGEASRQTKPNGAGQKRFPSWNVYPEHLRPESLTRRSNG
jgi:hypothetical protein